MAHESLLEGFMIIYGVFALSVLIAVTLTAASQPQLGFWATFKAAFRVLDRVLATSLVLGIGFAILGWIVIRLSVGSP